MLFDLMLTQDLSGLWELDFNRSAFEKNGWQKDPTEWKSLYGPTYGYLKSVADRINEKE